MSSILLCLVFGAFFTAQLNAQPPQVRQFLLRDGMPSNDFIFHLTQDSLGYIWGSTMRGLFRYDGYEFDEMDRESGLLDRMTLRTIEDPQHRVWVQTYSGEFAYFDGHSFIPYEHNHLITKLARFDHAWHFQVDRAGNLYLGTSGRGLWKVDTAGQLLQLFDSQKENTICFWIPDSMPPIAFGIKKAGTPSPMMRVMVLDDDLNVSCDTALPGRNPTREDRPFFCQRADGSYILLLGKTLYGLTAKRLLGYATQADLLNAVTEDQQGNLWIARRDGIGFIPKHHPLDYPQTLYYPGQGFHHILEDYEGGLWFGSERNGLLHAPDPIIKKSTQENGVLPAGQLMRVATSKEHTYVSTTQSHVIQVGGDSARLFPINELMSPPANRTIFAMHWDEQHERLLMSLGERIGCLHASGYFHELPIPSSLKRYRINSFMPSEDGSFIWATDYRGIFQIHGDSVERVFLAQVDQMSAMAIAPDGRTWMAGEKGVWPMHDSSLIALNNPHPVLHSRVFDILYHRDRLWVASTNFGLGVLHGDSLTIISESENGLRDAHELIGDNDTVWALGKTHLLKFIVYPNDTIVVEKRPINFDKSSIMFSMNLTSDRFAIASSNGLIELDRSAPPISKAPPLIHFRRITVNSRDTSIQSFYDLNHDQNYLQIDFVGISYRTPNMPYRYRMYGVDKEWQYTTSRSVAYKQMPPGDYTFMVYAQSIDGSISKLPATFTLRINSPFWSTWWFRSLSVFLVLAGIGFGVQTRLKRVNSQREVEQELLRLESKALRAQINPHFIFNALSAIQGYVSDGDATASEIYLAKFARLIRLILENSRESFILLSKEIETLEHYLELEQMRFRGSFDYEIILHAAILSDFVRIPPMLIQPHVENAILHGLANRDEQGKIWITFAQEDDHLVCEVRDNGSGRAEHSDKPSVIHHHKPLGMLITRDRLRLLNRQTTAKLKVEIRDISHSEGQSSGTCVTISLPFKQLSKHHATYENSYNRR